MEADPNRPDRSRAPESRPDTTRTPASTGVDVPDAEAFDHLTRHDPSRPAPSGAAAAAVDRMARWRGDDVSWVRACDALAQSSGRATGRGITWTAQANRLPRLTPLRQAGTGRRAIARASTTPRASQLAPIDAFGTRSDAAPSAGRTGVSR